MEIIIILGVGLVLSAIAFRMTGGMGLPSIILVFALIAAYPFRSGLGL